MEAEQHTRHILQNKEKQEEAFQKRMVDISDNIAKGDA